MSTIDPSRMSELIVAARAFDRRLPRRVPQQTRGLAERIARGDLQALATLCDGMLQDLLDYVNFRLDNVATTHEVVQDICLTANRRRSELSIARCSAAVWLMRIARERVRYIYGIDYTIQVTLAPSHPAYQTVEMLRRLEAELQECLMLRIVLRFSALDVAQIMGHSCDEQLIMQGSALAAVHDVAA